MKNNVIEISKVRVKEVVEKAKEACSTNYSEEQLLALQKAETKEIRIGRLKESNVSSVIPAEMVEKVASDNFIKTKTVNAALSWLFSTKPFLFLLGSVGRGKTVASAVILAQRPGFYIRVQVVESLFNQKYGIFVDNQNALLDKRLLVVDDLGTEKDPGSFTATLQRIVDSRQGGKFKTLFTSNLSKDKIFERYPDKRLISRLNQLALFIMDIGDDMRNK